MIQESMLDEVKEVKNSFTSSTSLTQNFFTESINGVIKEVVIKIGASASSQDITLFVSGTDEQIFNNNNIAQGTTSIVYPFVYGTDNSNTSGSPHTKIKRVINEPLRIRSTPGEGTADIETTFKYR